MKYLVMLCDGMADEPNEALGNSTPMEKANKPCMDSLAAKAEVGIVKTVAEGLKPGSDVANLSVLGYEPAVYYSGRSPLEAASIGIDLKDTDVTLRCNLVTLSDDEDYENKTILDYCADDISSKKLRFLLSIFRKNSEMMYSVSIRAYLIVIALFGATVIRIPVCLHLHTILQAR